MELENDTPIQNFYLNKSVFLTGASGFLGKILLEKLIRSCPGIKEVFILLRSKHNKSSEQRCNDFISSEAFSRCSNQALTKIVAIDGDITQPDLGLKPADRKRIIDEVSIVFHSAASVRFDEPFWNSLTNNFMATKSVLELCHEMPKLEAFVHVSTAYAFCHQSESKEIIYPLKISSSKILELANTMDNDSLEKLARTYYEDRPNFYTFTKALAEHYLLENLGELPVAIARPSVITATWKEPVQGWVDSINGPCGACMLGSLGIARTMDIKPVYVSDLIPADVVANALIAISWDIGTNHAEFIKNQPNKPKVFNITTGCVNPVTWEQFLYYGREAAVESPSIRMLRPPVRITQGAKVTRMEHLLTKYFSELLFAYLVDIMLFIMGHKRRVVKVVEKMHQAFDLINYFAQRQWSFPCDNLLSLFDRMEASDQKKFYFDLHQINWREYTHHLYLGIRKYILKEEESTIPQARKRMTRKLLRERSEKVNNCNVEVKLRHYQKAKNLSGCWRSMMRYIWIDRVAHGRYGEVDTRY